uniref:Zinc finger, CCHC-type n=1 Tax=Tanacetum cinerariifolium TaxID=118510 RepID=A0A6L2N879_TANCI|nr:hypothetical protein [Tanacetum cinerariifolium]
MAKEDALSSVYHEYGVCSNYTNDKICIILNGMSDSLFDIYQNVESGKELWDSLEAKYMAEDASTKKFFDSDKVKGNNVDGLSVFNMIEHNNSSRLGYVHYKRMQDMLKDGLILAFDMDTEKWVPDKWTEDIISLVVPEEVIEKVVVQQPELKKSKKNRTSKNYGPEFQLYIIKGTWDEMDVKTTFLNGKLDEEALKQCHQKFDEVVLSRGYLLNQADKCVYIKFDKPGKGVTIYLNVDDMLIIGTDQVQVDLTKKFLSSRFSMKDMRDADIIPVSTPMDTSEKIMPNNGKVVSQLEYFMVIDCPMYVIMCTRLDIAFVVGKLSRYTTTLKIIRLQVAGYSFLEEGVISWASNKQTCIKSSTMEYEFVALAHAGKEAEWLRNVILEIPL